MRTKEPSPVDRASKTLPTTSNGILDFALPANLEASEPPEARGLARDEVRLMVSREDALPEALTPAPSPKTARTSPRRGEITIDHARFRDLPDFLKPGDLVVINTSATRNAAVSALRSDGVPVVVHLSSRIPGDRWVVEIRKPEGNATAPFRTADVGDVYWLPKGVTITLRAPYRAPDEGPVRLWEAKIDLGSNAVALAQGFGPLRPQSWGNRTERTDAFNETFDAYLLTYGRPIRYKYVDRDWPSEYYQTVYADEMGSAEMPSAGRGFTEDILRRLREKKVGIAPLILHTGVASLENHEPPYDEYYRVPAETAEAVNVTRRNGGRVIAVGTTVVRALETVTEYLPPTPSLQEGAKEVVVHAGEGWTDLVITPERGLSAVDGLITGLHEPEATHLLMLLSMASPAHLRSAYRAALDNGYLWHEFGDLHLLLR